MNICKTCNGRGKVQAGYAGEELADCPDCGNNSPEGLEFPNGVLAKYAMGLPPESVKDNDGDYIKGWNRALVLAEDVIEEMNQAEREIRKPALE